MKWISEQLKTEAIQDSTKKTYHNIWENFNKFIIRLDEIPNTWEDRVILYCSYLIDIKHLQSSTIKTYLSAIKCILTQDGYEWKNNKFELNAMTRSCKLKFDMVKNRFPIKLKLLELIIKQIHSSLHDQIYLLTLYTTVFLICYYGLLRVGEVSLSKHSIKAVDEHQAKNRNKLKLILHSSKTHGRNKRPQEIEIIGRGEITVNTPDGKTTILNHKLVAGTFCPVEWTKKYIELRPIITNLEEQLFIFRDGSPLLAHHIRNKLRSTLTELQLEGNYYDVHSFRIGRATDLDKHNIPIDRIKQIGRWASNAVYAYIRNYQ